MESLQDKLEEAIREWQSRYADIRIPEIILLHPDTSERLSKELENLVKEKKGIELMESTAKGRKYRSVALIRTNDIDEDVFKIY